MSTDKLNLNNGTAVITGAASGIGLELAKQASVLDMNLVLADIDHDGLLKAQSVLSLPDNKIKLVKTDVSSEEDVAHLCNESFESFGSVELLCNNAGVCLNRLSWEYTSEDWNWLINVNLMSISNAIRYFVPKMLKQNNRSHILNTASAAGLISTPGMAAYNASKHGVVTLSETLHQELIDIDAPIGVSILCPAWVPTQIHESSRNRLDKYGTQNSLKSDASKMYEEQMANAVNSGKLSAQQIAALSFSGIMKNDLYIIPHQKINTLIEQRTKRIIQK